MTKNVLSMNRRKFLELVASISAGTAGGLGMISLSDEAKIYTENIHILKGKNAPYRYGLRLYGVNTTTDGAGWTHKPIRY